MAWTIHPEAECEFDTVRDRGEPQAEDLFAVMSKIDDTSKRVDAAQSSQPAFIYRESDGSCAGLYLFKVGNVLGCCDLVEQESGAPDRFPMRLLALGEIGDDRTNQEICARAQGRKP
jgi:hypothetical protein